MESICLDRYDERPVCFMKGDHLFVDMKSAFG